MLTPSNSTPTLVAAASLALLALGLAGCKPEVGDICKPGQRTCLDPQTALQCQKGKYISTPCKGPEGCKETTDEKERQCDFSGNADGDVCPIEQSGKEACTPDGKSVVACVEGHYRILPCRGAEGCKKPEKGKLKCDSSVGKVGDPCLSESYFMCDEGKKSVLGCKNEKLEVAYLCRGPAGCKPTSGDTPSCDQSVAEPGDTCAKGSACSSDKKSVLNCQAQQNDAGILTTNAFSVAQTCKAGECSLKAGTKDVFVCPDEKVEEKK